MLIADTHGLSSAASEVDTAADTLADIDISTPFADASDALVGSATSQAAAVAVIGLVGIAVWGVLTQPLTNAVFGVGGALLVVLLVGGLALRRHELDTANGALVRAWGPVIWRRVPWRSARVRLLPNGAGQLQLAVSPPSGRATHLPLVAADLGGARSQTPGFLRVLADEVERGGHAGVAGRLRAQADHLDEGGDVIGSPLHRLISTPA